MITDIPLSELENKDEKVFYIKFRYFRYFRCLLILLTFIFLCTLLGYIYTKKHDVAWLYINFLVGLFILILMIPHILSIYVTCNERKKVDHRIEADIEF